MPTPQELLDQDPTKATRMGWFGRLFTIVAAVGGMGYFGMEHDYFGVAAVGLIAFGAFTGFRTGLSRIGATLVGFAVAFMFAPQFGMEHEAHFSNWLGTTGLLNRFIAVGVIGLLLSGATAVVLMFISGRIMRRRPGLAATNHWLGYGVGAVQAAAAVLVFVGGLLMIEPTELQRANDPNLERSERSEKVSNVVLTVTEAAHNSKLGPYIEEYNPFVRIPQLNKLEEIQKSVQVLSNPGEIDRLLKDPALETLKSSEEVKTAVNALMADPEITTLFQAGSMDRDAAMQLLSHPAILELCDQPGFVDQIRELIDRKQLQTNIQI